MSRYGSNFFEIDGGWQGTISENPLAGVVAPKSCWKGLAVEAQLPLPDSVSPATWAKLRSQMRSLINQKKENWPNRRPLRYPTNDRFTRGRIPFLKYQYDSLMCITEAFEYFPEKNKKSKKNRLLTWRQGKLWLWLFYAVNCIHQWPFANVH